MSMTKLDQAILGLPGADGTIPFVRNQDGVISFGTATPVQEGQPVNGGKELVQFRRRAENPQLCDCTTLLEETSPTARPPASVKTEKPPEDQEAPVVAHNGPPRVTSRAFRQGWDAIFKKQEPN